MLGFISRLWKKRKVNRTQSAVLGDCDETLMCLPSDTAAWVVAKFNELTGALNAKEQELKIARRRILVLSQTLDEIMEAARPFVVDGGVARKAFSLASAALKV
jgi:hypothetical protein